VTELKKQYNITIYTDGASRGNPGPGGYGIVMMSGSYAKEFSAGYKLTTNNRMELLAVITALENLKQENCNVTIYTDSKYVVDSVNKGWLTSWVQKDFKGKKNPDLWIRFLKTYKKHNINFIWIKGHSENKYNERCDELAVKASKEPVLLDDVGYEAGI
jgi:ribonuclease HI